MVVAGTAMVGSGSESDDAELDFLWLELTGKCQLECVHCYAESGPRGSHGAMTRQDWMRVIDEAAMLGVETIQFIGGEPTLHPDFRLLVTHAVEGGTEIEVYTNLVKVPVDLWELFSHPSVRLATSYYSQHDNQHRAITRRPTHDLTLRNICEAVERGIPIRVGVVGVRQDQDVDGAVAQLRRLGIADIGVDHLRRVGRGNNGGIGRVDQLCGQCAHGKLAIVPDGTTYPCVFGRWLPVGNARHASLAALNQAALATRADLRLEFGKVNWPCDPCRPSTGDGGCKPFCSPVMDCKPMKGR